MIEQYDLGASVAGPYNMLAAMRLQEAYRNALTGAKQQQSPVYNALAQHGGPTRAAAAAMDSGGSGEVGVAPYGATDDIFSFDGLDIRYAGDPKFHYGRSATSSAAPFGGVVFHHTATGTGLDNMVDYGKTVDAARGGAFGYHFYVGPNGEIVQGAPLSKRTNHIKPTHDVGLRNSNSIGVSLVGAEGGATQAQQAAAEQLARALADTYGIQKFYGHGEIQGNRQEQEGAALASALRSYYGG